MPADEALNPIILRAYNDLVAKVVRLAPPDARAIGPLLASFGAGEGRGAYAKAVAWIETFPAPVAGPPLARALEKGEVGARRWAAHALGRLGWAEAIPALRVAREDKDAIVRGKASLALRILESGEEERAARAEDDEDAPDPMFDGLTVEDERAREAARRAEREAEIAAARGAAEAEQRRSDAQADEDAGRLFGASGEPQ